MSTERRGKRLPQFLVNQIRRLRRQNVSIRKIAELSGVSKCAVEAHCKGIQVSGKPAEPPATPPPAEPDLSLAPLAAGSYADPKTGATAPEATEDGFVGQPEPPEPPEAPDPADEREYDRFLDEYLSDDETGMRGQ